MDALEFIPGGFIYLGARHALSGYPLRVLRSIAGARHRTKTAAQLIAEIWGADYFIAVATVKSHVCTVRRALRRAIRKSGVRRYGDPLPAVDRGRDLAWMLNLPAAA